MTTRLRLAPWLRHHGTCERHPDCTCGLNATLLELMAEEAKAVHQAHCPHAAPGFVEDGAGVHVAQD